MYLRNRLLGPVVPAEVGHDGWAVVQRRGQFGNSDSYFLRSFVEYERGFGAIEAEFWLGLNALHEMTRGHEEQVGNLTQCPLRSYINRIGRSCSSR